MVCGAGRGSLRDQRRAVSGSDKARPKTDQARKRTSGELTAYYPFKDLAPYYPKEPKSAATKDY